MGAAALTPRCYRCQKTWWSKYDFRPYLVSNKVGMRLMITGRRRPMRRTSSGQYMIPAEVKCLDCGHHFFSVHPQIIRSADQIKEQEDE